MRKSTLIVFLFALGALSIVKAQTQVIVPSASGGPTVNYVGLLASEISAQGLPMQVIARLGEGGLLGLSEITQMPTDGKNYGVLTGSAFFNAKFGGRPDLLEAIKPITLIGIQGYALVVPGNGRVSTVADLIAVGKSRELVAGNSGQNSITEQCISQFARSANVRVNSVPYKGAAPVMADLLANQIDFSCLPMTVLKKYFQDKTLKVIAITMSEPSIAFPGVQTLDAMNIKGVIRGDWMVLVAPIRTPDNLTEPVLYQAQRAVTKLGFINSLQGLIEVLPDRAMNPTTAKGFISRQ
jgi:tripartite-type tricarboxylate transporter receptor subunit TctC